MALIAIEYWYSGNNRKRTATFNDATGEITSPMQWFEAYAGQPLKDIGEIVFSDANWEVRANGASPYFVVGFAPGTVPSCTISDLGVEVLTADDGTNSGSIKVTMEVPSGYPQFRLQSETYDSGWIDAVYTGAGLTYEYTFSGLPAGTYSAIGRDVESPGCQIMVDATVVEEGGTTVYPDLTAAIGQLNESNPTLNDGRLDAAVLTGSGSYKIIWYDATETILNPGAGNIGYASKTNVPAGTYSTQILDLLSGQSLNLSNTITEPVIEPEQPSVGDFLEVPILNPIRFVIQEEVDNEDIYQTLDNLLLCNQFYPGHARTHWNQKYIKTDTPVIQFNSNFSVHTMKLKDKNEQVVKTFGVVKKLSLSAYVEEHNIRIRSHPADASKSRVYFVAGTIPLPIAVNDTFEITNNADGFDGTYAVQGIEVDLTLNLQYLLINLVYDSVNSFSSATGNFRNSDEDYDVYESILNFIDVADGLYFLELIGGEGDDAITAVSEPLDIKVSHPNTVLLLYSNTDNGYDVSWETGFVGRIRIDALIGHKRIPKGEQSIVRNSSYDIIKTESRSIRGILFEVFAIPPYMHEKLAVIFRLDTFSINGVSYQTAENWQTPQFNYKSLLASSSIELEQIGWFRKYNNHDIGSIADGGFITTENGYLKR